MNKVEKHHVLYPSRIWGTFESSRRLRQTPELIVPMFKTAHTHLHDVLEQVPLPDTYMLDYISKNYEPVKDNPIKSIFALQNILHEATYEMRTSEIGRLVGEVAIRALNMQVPIIQQGIATL